jgi:hypothetical protein
MDLHACSWQEGLINLELRKKNLELGIFLAILLFFITRHASLVTDNESHPVSLIFLNC